MEMMIFIILLYLFGEIKKTYKKNECLVLYYRTMNSRTEKMLMATSTELFIFNSICPTTHLHHRIIIHVGGLWNCCTNYLRTTSTKKDGT